jgi:hypothetical protein
LVHRCSGGGRSADSRYRDPRVSGDCLSRQRKCRYPHSQCSGRPGAGRLAYCNLNAHRSSNTSLHADAGAANGHPHLHDANGDANSRNAHTYRTARDAHARRPTHSNGYAYSDSHANSNGDADADADAALR